LLLGHFNTNRLSIHFYITLHKENDQVILILSTGCNINIFVSLGKLNLKNVMQRTSYNEVDRMYRPTHNCGAIQGNTVYINYAVSFL